MEVVLYSWRTINFVDSAAEEAGLNIFTAYWCVAVSFVVTVTAECEADEPVSYKFSAVGFLGYGCSKVAAIEVHSSPVSWGFQPHQFMTIYTGTWFWKVAIVI